MKYFENYTTFHYTWDQVAQGFWKRYPNPESAHVLTEDTISREVKNGKLYSKRVFTKTNRVPKWGEKFVNSGRFVKIIEESVVDPNEKLLVTYTRNIGLTAIMSIVEKVTYKESQDNANYTIIHRYAWIDSRVYGFRSAITAFGVERFRKNCVKMMQGFSYVLAQMFPSSATTFITEESSNHLTKTEKLRDVAKTASDLAKSKANAMFVSCEATDL